MNEVPDSYYAIAQKTAKHLRAVWAKKEAEEKRLEKERKQKERRDKNEQAVHRKS